MRSKYLAVLRTLKQTCVNDAHAERQITAAIRTSISQLVRNKVGQSEIETELEMTEKMLRLNLAQVAYNEKLDSYAVKVTEEMVPSAGAVVDIMTPQDFFKQTSGTSLHDIAGTHKVS